MKRYVIELANDIEKRLSAMGKEKESYQIFTIRNGYISGLCTELDAIRAIIDIVNNTDVR